MKDREKAAAKRRMHRGRPRIPGSSAQNEHSIKTADKLAKVHGVARETTLGGPNGTPDQASYLRGLEYRFAKKPEGGQIPGSMGKSCPTSTAEKLAKGHGVSPRTIKDDAAFAEAVDALDAGAEGAKHCVDFVPDL